MESPAAAPVPPPGPLDGRLEAERRLQSRLLDAAVLLAAFVFAALYARATASRIGPTFDETTYVSAGLAVHRTGSHAGLMKLGTMPLPVDVATFPIALAERLAQAPLDAREDLDVLLPLARAGALPFLALLLATAMRLGRRAGGAWGGRLAALLLAAEPSVLAHGALATTDVAVTALLLGQLDAFLAGRGKPWPRRIGLPGLWAAGALLAKASSVVFGPLLLLAGELHRLRGEDRLPSLPAAREALRPFVADVARIALLALLGALLWCGSDFRPERSFLAWARGLEGPAGPPARLVAENLRVFPNALEGIVRQLKHNVLGHGVYLLGRTHPRAVPWYFPAALALKLSPGVLIALALLLLARPRALASEAGYGALALVAFSFAYRVQIGVRLVLPLVALLLVAVAAAAADAATGARPARRLAAGTLATLLPLSAAAASLRAFPDALCYANLLAGGTDRAFLALSDSNHDWGQGLPALRRACAARALAAIDVWYFGTDPAVERPPFRRVDPLAPPRRELSEVASLLRGNLLAVGTTFLHGAYVREPLPPWLLDLRAREPAFRTRTFLVYDLSAERRRNATTP